MANIPSTSLPAPVGYRSGVAARLAGIPVETLRVWERRYGVVGPRTSERGHRFYSADDVSRLSVIRQLVDLGTAIGSVARLPLDELREMLAAGRAAAHGMPDRRSRSLRAVRVAVVGTALAANVARDAAFIDNLEMVASSTTPAHALGAFRGVAADVVAIEMPALQSDALAQVDALIAVVGARHAIVAYRFAPQAVVSALRDAGHVTVRAPLDAHQLERLCRDDSTTTSTNGDPPPPGPVPQPSTRRFDDQALTDISRSLTTLYCECPRHVVDLLVSLGTFEQYSADCANRSPADARLHRYLQQVAATTRAMFEDALVRIAQAEGLTLPDARSTADA